MLSLGKNKPPVCLCSRLTRILGGFTKNFLHGKNEPPVCFCTRLMIIFANVPLMFPRRTGGPDAEHLSVNLKQTNIGNNEREKIHYL